MLEISTSALYQLSLFVRIKSTATSVTSSLLKHDTLLQPIEHRQTKLINIYIDITINSIKESV